MAKCTLLFGVTQPLRVEGCRSLGLGYLRGDLLLTRVCGLLAGIASGAWVGPRGGGRARRADRGGHSSLELVRGGWHLLLTGVQRWLQ
jgi:hypothetical protein